MNNDEIQKFLDGPRAKAKSTLNSVHITSTQARTAGVMSQVGGGAGAVTGAIIGTGIGAATHHPAQGAGIGAGIGGALGGSGGSALGLYAGRPKKKLNRVAMPKPVNTGGEEQGHVEVHKALNTRTTSNHMMTAGGALAAGSGGAAGLHALSGLQAKKKATETLGNAGSHAEAVLKPGLSLSERLQHGIRAFDAGKTASTAGEAALGARAAMHTNLKIAGAGAALAGAGALLRAGTPKQPKPALAPIGKSFTHPTDATQHKLAQGGLGLAAAADAAGAVSAFNETKNATKPVLAGLSAGKKVKAVANFAREKSAFPIVAAGIGATALAEHVMHNQQKAHPVVPTPPGMVHPKNLS